jgi:hypothetical protein
VTKTAWKTVVDYEVNPKPMPKPTNAGIYEVGILAIGASVSGLSTWHYAVSGTHTQGCLVIAGVCLAFFLLLLTFVEVVGILAAVIVSVARQSYFASELLPHAAVAVGVTLGLAVFVRVSF